MRHPGGWFLPLVRVLGHSSGAMRNVKFVMTPPTNPMIIGSGFTAKSGWKMYAIKEGTKKISHVCIG